MAAILLLPPPANLTEEVSRNQCIPGHENTTLTAPGVGNLYIVDDNDGIIHLLVNEINLKVNSAVRTPGTPLDWEVCGGGSLWKGHPELRWCGGRQ